MVLPHFLHLPFLPINVSDRVYTVEQDGQIILIGISSSFRRDFAIPAGQTTKNTLHCG
jgi:hypothetical protein